MQRTRKRTIAAISGVVTVVAAVVATVLLWPQPHKAAPTVAVLPQPVPAPVIETPVAQDKPALAHVTASAPIAFRLSGPAFTIDAKVCGMPYVRPLDPPGDQVHTVCWVDHDFGVAPGSPSTGTTYVLGHAWAEAKLVLNPLSEFATAHASARPRTLANGVAVFDFPAIKGYRLRLDTARGHLTYSVSAGFLVAKSEAGNVASVMAQTIRNRVVIITCAVKNGVDLDQNVIVYANLVGAARR